MNDPAEAPLDEGGMCPVNGNGADAVASDLKAEKSATTTATDDATSILLGQIKHLEQKITNIEMQCKQAPKNGDSSMLFGHMTAHLAAKNSLDQYLSDTNHREQVWTKHQAVVKEMGTNQVSSAADFANKTAIEKYLEMERFRMTNRHIDEEYAYNRFEEYLKQYYDEGKLHDEGEMDNDGEIDLENPPDVDVLTPSLSSVGWKDFSARSPYNFRMNTSKGPFVIDVLEGEPILPELGFNSWGFGPKKAPGFPDTEAAVGSKKTAEPGHAPLPERIRIHSRPLASILEKIHESDIPISNKDTLVMLRPFKALTFYESQFREHYAELEKKFGAKNDGIAASAGEGESAEKESSENVSSGHEVSTAGNTSVADTTETTQNLEEGVKEEGKHAPDAQRNKDDHGYSNNNESEAEEESPTTTRLAFDHLHCLLNFIDIYIVAKKKYLNEPSCKVYFTDLWHVFKPGDHIIESANKNPQCYRVLHVKSPRHKAKEAYNWPQFRDKKQTEKRFSIYCVSVDFDGKFLGPVPKTVDIFPYEGPKDITSLPAYPLKFSKDPELRESLIDRGKKFVQVVGIKHMHFSGLTLEKRDEVDSQVVIDFDEAFNENYDWKPEIDHTGDGEEMFKSFDEDEACSGACCVGEQVHDDHYVDEKQNAQFMASLLPETDEEGSPLSLAIVPRALRKDRNMRISYDDFIIMSYRVFGFVLRSKTWAKLNLNDLVDVDEYQRKQKDNGELEGDRKQNAFDSLVFPKDGLDRKNIIKSLVSQHFQDKESLSSREEQADIVRGKGKGLIILLHGAPGVGKTTTAEGIAEVFNKPLFQITCGDLGTQAKDVEVALEKSFSLANKWGSILLLDEADVFLARRTPQDFIRNGLVAVFLRVLEYYAGILFLTTNRIGDFDEAFSSRIHVSLHYPELDCQSALEIFDLNWKLMESRFRKQGRELEIDKVGIAVFANDYWRDNETAHWNGRQIRNACQTALALAESEAQTTEDGVIGRPKIKATLKVSHIKTVAEAYLGFMEYLHDVRDADQEKWAYMMGIRRQGNRDGSKFKPENMGYGHDATSFRRGGSSRLAERRAQLASMRHQRDHHHQQPPPPQPPHHQGDGSGAYAHLTTPDRQQYRGAGPFYSPSPEPQYPLSHSPQPQPQPQPQHHLNQHQHHGWPNPRYPDGGPGEGLHAQLNPAHGTGPRQYRG